MAVPCGRSNVNTKAPQNRVNLGIDLGICIGIDPLSDYAEHLDAVLGFLELC